MPDVKLSKDGESFMWWASIMHTVLILQITFQGLDMPSTISSNVLGARSDNELRLALLANRAGSVCPLHHMPRYIVLSSMYMQNYSAELNLGTSMQVWWCHTGSDNLLLLAGDRELWQLLVRTLP